MTYEHKVINEKRSFTEYTVSSPTQSFAIGFELYEDEQNIHVTLDNTPITDLGYTFAVINSLTIEVTPAIPSGVLRIQRETDIDDNKHKFSAGAIFNALSMDENFEQIRQSQQETRDGFVNLSDRVVPLVDGLEEALDQATIASQAAQAAADAAAEVAQVTRSASQVIDASGKTQQQINDELKTASPYSANNYPTINDAVQQSPLGNTVHLNIGEYVQPIDLNKVNLQGKGYGTVLKVQPNSYGIKSLQTGPNWDRMRISDIAFKGVSRVGTVGFQFDPADPFAGRRNIEYCTFDNLDIGIYKPTGNIGNTYSSISVSNSNYGYRVKSSETPLMHAGNDRFIDAQFNGIAKWAIDLENTSGSDGFGQFTVDNSIFQFCAGGGIRLDMGNIVPICPPVIRNSWFEEIATPNTTVNRDGVDEAPREIKLINCPIVFVEGCYLKNIELINSTMITKGCRIDTAATAYNIIVKDATSQIFADDVYMDGTISTNVTVRSVAKQKRISYGTGGLTFLSTPIRSVTKKPSNAATFIGQTFRGGVVGTTTWAVTGSQTVFATCVDDGGEAVAKLPMQVGITNVLGSFGIHNNMWVVWGFSVKPLTPLTGTFDFKNDQNLGNITMKVGEWTHNVGIAKSGVTGYVAAWLQPSSNGDLLIKDYFVAEFAKEEDALNFVNSRMSIDNT